mmetsp:Transcript_101337/g.293064  ORF Transcript_101337/g.293064 Transcript_101337/m.293064 type:complete len:273 (-) Transcript_101337:395-1213(-)
MIVTNAATATVPLDQSNANAPKPVPKKPKVENSRRTDVRDKRPERTKRSLAKPMITDNAASVALGQNMTRPASATPIFTPSTRYVTTQPYSKYRLNAKSVWPRNAAQTDGIRSNLHAMTNGDTFSAFFACKGVASKTPCARKSSNSVVLMYLHSSGDDAANFSHKSAKSTVPPPHMRIAIRHPRVAATCGMMKSATNAPMGPPASEAAVAKALSPQGTQRTMRTPVAGSEGPSKQPMISSVSHMQGKLLVIPRVRLPKPNMNNVSAIMGLPP